MPGAGRRTAVVPRTGSSRGGVRRLLVVGVVLTVVVLGVNSIVASSSKDQDVTLAFLDRVRPPVDRSTGQGTELDDLRVRAVSLGRPGLSRALDRLSREAARSRDEVGEIRPPEALRDAHSLLLACLNARATGVATVQRALGTALEEGPAEQAVQDLVAAGQDLTVADRAYELFVETLPEATRTAMPASKWATEPDAWDRAEVGSFVSSLRSSTSLAKVHDLAIVTFSTEPAAVAMEGPNPVLPTTRSVKLQVVVANVGNESEKKATVEAEVTSEGGMDAARQFVDLAPAEQVTVPLTIRPAPVGTITIVVRAVAVGGESNIADNERSYSFVMR